MSSSFTAKYDVGQLVMVNLKDHTYTGKICRICEVVVKHFRRYIDVYAPSRGTEDNTVVVYRVSSLYKFSWTDSTTIREEDIIPYDLAKLSPAMTNDFLDILKVRGIQLATEEEIYIILQDLTSGMMTDMNKNIEKQNLT